MMQARIYGVMNILFFDTGEANDDVPQEPRGALCISLAQGRHGPEAHALFRRGEDARDQRHRHPQPN